MIQAERIHTLKAHNGTLYALAPGRVMHSLFSAGADNVVAEWNLQTGKTNPFAIRTTHTVYSLLNLNRKQLVIGVANGGMHVIDLDSKREVRLLQFHNKGIFYMAQNPASGHVLACSADGAASVWNPEDWSLLWHLPVTHQKVRRAAYDKDGKLLALACGDGFVRIFETVNHREIAAFPAHETSANSLVFLPNGNLLTGGKDAYLRIWNTADGFEMDREVAAHNFAIYDIVLSPDSNITATVSRDKTVKLWETENISTPVRLDRAASGGHINSVNAALWLPEENILATCGDDRTVVLWNAAHKP